MKTLVQIGSNIGNDHFFHYCDQLKDPHNIHLIEPNPELIPELQKNYTNLHILHNICFHNIGIVTEIYNDNILYLYDNHTHSSLLRRKSYDKSLKQIIFTPVLFDDFCILNKIETIDLLSIDTEGFDYEILYSLNINKINILKIYFELWLHPDDDLNYKIRSGPNFLPIVLKKYTSYDLSKITLDNQPSYCLRKNE